MTKTLRRTRHDLPAYIGLAFGGIWLAMSPLLISGFHRDSNDLGMGTLQLVCVYAAMLAPALAAVIVMRRRTPNLRKALGLELPHRVMDCVLAIVVPLGLTVASLVVAWLAGTYKFELSNLSGIIGWIAPLALQYVLSLPFFFGEELGWQGYLLPRLLQYGRLVGYLGTAVIFALWHLPTLLMGGQYPGHSLAASVGALVVSCLLVVPIFSWLRKRSNSVLPAVLAHAVVSSLAMRTVFFLSAPGQDMDPMQVGLQAWPGWVVMAAFVAWLVKTRRI
ncbi:CPBP family intramembrane glutamic endopeptidase [Kribbella solani]|uniref:Membrane protease YdiL (CAAX protease family) n=1 Tax=Kribbella solani TaxID=236067 RepID=A0A841DJ03_9ACTN|nr:CPBP family intramembrane glutamic endopeptidase [Kribbella solani]MBB5977055.1 membrane protease YdiL (CAAX protease family) [Kribbella solani]